MLRSSEGTAGQVWVTKGEGLTAQFPTTNHHSQADGGQESSEGAEECSRQARRPPQRRRQPRRKGGQPSADQRAEDRGRGREALRRKGASTSFIHSYTRCSYIHVFIQKNI